MLSYTRNAVIMLAVYLHGFFSKCPSFAICHRYWWASSWLWTTLCLKNVSSLSCYNFEVRKPMLINFGSTKAGSQNMLYFLTSH